MAPNMWEYISALDMRKLLNVPNMQTWTQMWLPSPTLSDGLCLEYRGKLPVGLSQSAQELCDRFWAWMTWSEKSQKRWSGPYLENIYIDTVQSRYRQAQKNSLGIIKSLKKEQWHMKRIRRKDGEYSGHLDTVWCFVNFENFFDSCWEPLN